MTFPLNVFANSPTPSIRSLRLHMGLLLTTAAVGLAGCVDANEQESLDEFAEDFAEDHEGKADSFSTRTRLRGRVADFQTGAPIAGVEVCANTPRNAICSTTDAGGEYLLTELLALRVYEITMNADGFAPANVWIRTEREDSSLFNSLVGSEAYAGIVASFGFAADPAKGLLIKNAFTFASGEFPEDTPEGDFGFDNPQGFVGLAGASYRLYPEVEDWVYVGGEGQTSAAGLAATYVDGDELYIVDVSTPDEVICNHRLIPSLGDWVFTRVRPGHVTGTYTRCIAE